MPAEIAGHRGVVGEHGTNLHLGERPGLFSIPRDEELHTWESSMWIPQDERAALLNVKQESAAWALFARDDRLAVDCTCARRSLCRRAAKEYD